MTPPESDPPAPSGEHPLGSTERPLRVAVIGAGPAGFYAADSLFKRAGLTAYVDLFDRLPAPYGLVRYGVAPDHPGIKKVIKTYDRVASHERFRFFGNVQLGRDVQVADLRRLYDRICYTVGAETDRRMGIPGEDLAGSHSSTRFVGWYNGHPDHRDLRFDLSGERAAVIGIGNVAMDVCRILLRSREELAKTDIAAHALEVLRGSRVREVLLLGRRGPAQAAFTPKEIRELGELDGVDLVVRPEDLEGAGGGDAPDDYNVRKNLEYLAVAAARGEGDREKKVRLRFFASPVEILGEDGRVSAIRVERTELVPDERGTLRARGTGRVETVPVQLVVRAIGYRGVPLEGVPFHERWGVICNDDGRVTDGEGGAVVPHEYVAGWAKRGPTGLVGTNKGCAADTVARLVEDLEGCTAAALPASWADETPALLDARGVRWVSFDDWRALDRHEVERGASAGKPREKVVVPDEMLAVVEASRART
jgi:ferredoxin--NADP+ reductase